MLADLLLSLVCLLLPTERWGSYMQLSGPSHCTLPKYKSVVPRWHTMPQAPTGRAFTVPERGSLVGSDKHFAPSRGYVAGNSDKTTDLSYLVASSSQ